jgi:hypothetical protein
MNELKVNLQHSILALAGNGCSNRRIARELGVHRETVGEQFNESTNQLPPRQGHQNPTNLQPGASLNWPISKTTLPN